MKTDERTVVVTGASTGIGRACALDLAARGWRVYGSVRREADADALERASDARVRPVMLDVTDGQSIAALRERLESELNGSGLDGLVNNAGVALAGPLELMDVAAFRHQLEVNVTGQLAVTQALVPMLRTARGRIVMMSSVGGRSVAPFLGPYCASKYALEAMSDALRVELAPWGIALSIVEPATIKTPIWRKSEEHSERAFQGREDEVERLYGRQVERLRWLNSRQDASGVEPEVVVRAVRHALTAKRPRTRYLVGGMTAWVRASMQKLPDRLRDRLYRMLLDA